MDQQECVPVIVENHTAYSQATPSASVSTAPLTTDERPSLRTFVIYGMISAILGLLIFPEIVDPAAIILGAYIWKNGQGNRGLYVIILGIGCMLVGIYFTAFRLVDL